VQLCARLGEHGLEPPGVPRADTDAAQRELGVALTPVADWARTLDWEAAGRALAAAS